MSREDLSCGAIETAEIWCPELVREERVEIYTDVESGVWTR